jgi:non-ribosomal peptide synthase protein (TIGR01720 family)
LFNYLGRFAAGSRDEQPWQAAPEAPSLGGGADPAMPMAFALEINAHTQDTPAGASLVAELTWPRHLVAEHDVRALVHTWRRALSVLAGCAATPEAGARTPSDLALVSLSQTEIDLLEADWRL